MSLSTDDKMAVIVADRGISLETYVDRRALVERQLWLLFSDRMIEQPHPDTILDNLKALQEMATELEAGIRAMPNQMIDEWYKMPETDESDEREETQV
jgi:hypothetical protein